MSKLLVYSDGGCTEIGTRKAAAYGSFAAYLVDDKSVWGGTGSERRHMELTSEKPLVHCARESLVMDPNVNATNNMAEAMTLESALIWVLRWLHQKKVKVTCVEVCMDSRLVAFQVQGIYRTHCKNLRKVYGRILDLMYNITSTGCEIKITWIPGDLMKKTIIRH